MVVKTILTLPLILQETESLASDVCTGQVIAKGMKHPFSLAKTSFQTQFSTSVRTCIFFPSVKILFLLPPRCPDSLSTPVQTLFPSTNTNWL